MQTWTVWPQSTVFGGREVAAVAAVATVTPKLTPPARHDRLGGGRGLPRGHGPRRLDRGGDRGRVCHVQRVAAVAHDDQPRLAKPAVEGLRLRRRRDAVVGADDHHDGDVELAVRAREDAQVGRRPLEVFDRAPERAGTQPDGQGRAGVVSGQGLRLAGQTQQLVTAQGSQRHEHGRGGQASQQGCAQDRVRRARAAGRAARGRRR